MKRTMVFILIIALLISTLCSCEAPEKTSLEQGKSYEVVIKDDYKVTIEVISQTAEYFEVAVTKEKTDGYFHIDSNDSENPDPILCDLAFIDRTSERQVFKYVLVNDTTKIEGDHLGGGIHYGCPWTFFISSFDGSINLKFYFYHTQTEDYTVKMFTKEVLDYGIIKVDAVKNEDGGYNPSESIINAIAFEVE